MTLRPLHSVWIAAFFGAAIGCSCGAEVPKGDNVQSGDLGAFILSSAPEFGVRLLTTNDLPLIRANWSYRKSSNELAVFLGGNYFPQLHVFLTKAVGPPAAPPRTNDLRGIEVYYGTNVGAGVGCGLNIGEDGKEYTGLVIIGYSPLQVVQSFKALVNEAERGKDYFKALDEVRASAPYVSDFVRLFPKAEVRYRYFAGTGEPGFDVEVDLHERYELRMHLPVHFDSSRRSVTGYGEPTFHLFEVASRKGRATSYNPAGDRTFGPAEWTRIVETGGEFNAIGYTMVTNRPVPGFKDGKGSKVEK